MFLERFIHEKYGKTVCEENISAWRRAMSGDLTSVFRPYDPKKSGLDFLNRDKFVVSIEEARYKEIPSNYKILTAEQIEEISRFPRHSGLMPRQEEGIRPACALPYELYADGRLGADGKYFEIRLGTGNKSAGAPFNVYLRNTKESGERGMVAATYAVKTGDNLTRQYPFAMFADSGYAIEVYGPNGFYRSFTGRADSTHVEMRMAYQQRGKDRTGNLVAHLHNGAGKPVTVEIKDNAYKTNPVSRTIEPGQEISVILRLEQSHGWYDYTVGASGSNAEARFAGHVETGRASFTDPLMGGVV
jgi:phospholipase C